jgi:site-specific recombinase XerD
MINANHFIEVYGRAMPVASIDQELMDVYVKTLKKQGMTHATINRCISAVSTVINHCAQRTKCKPSPTFTRLKESEGRITFYTKQQVNQMASAAKDIFRRNDLSELVLFGGYTGLRQGEILKLRARDIDRGRQLIHVAAGKTGKVREIPIHSAISDLVQERMECTSSPHDYVFDEWNNKDQVRRAFNKVLNYVVDDTEGMCFHTLRHSFATWHIEAGTQLRVLMELMGHTRIETTIRYAKATPKAAIAAMSNI